MLRPESGLFFANADAVGRAVRVHARRPEVHAVVLDAETVPYLDVTAARALDGLATDLAAGGVTLALAHGIGHVRDVVAVSGNDANLALFETVDAAVTALRRPR